jgi:hypothetical protein
LRGLGEENSRACKDKSQNARSRDYIGLRRRCNVANTKQGAYHSAFADAARDLVTTDFADWSLLNDAACLIACGS